MSINNIRDKTAIAKSYSGFGCCLPMNYSIFKLSQIPMTILGNLSFKFINIFVNAFYCICIWCTGNKYNFI